MQHCISINVIFIKISAFCNVLTTYYRYYMIRSFIGEYARKVGKKKEIEIISLKQLWKNIKRDINEIDKMIKQSHLRYLY